MGISIWQLLIVLLIVLLLFGTKRLRTIGGDLGSAIKGFRSAVKDGEKEADEAEEPAQLQEPGEAVMDANATSGATAGKESEAGAKKRHG